MLSLCIDLVRRSFISLQLLPLLYPCWGAHRPGSWAVLLVF
uniref:Uncharacterized protein n=1 Tax=Anguilla anguilla TaxID=7936 RepID=A0A0E9PNB6_ANGAN